MGCLQQGAEDLEAVDVVEEFEVAVEDRPAPEGSEVTAKGGATEVEGGEVAKGVAATEAEAGTEVEVAEEAKTGGLKGEAAAEIKAGAMEADDRDVAEDMAAIREVAAGAGGAPSETLF